MILIRWNYFRTLEKNVRTLLAEGSNRTMFGWRELEVVDNHLLIKTRWMELRLDLLAVDRIVSDGNYAYVYIASIQAYVVPMNLSP